ncbi:hypothetical protein GCM10009678_86180 [Actinomadura kijaniata]
MNTWNVTPDRPAPGVTLTRPPLTLTLSPVMSVTVRAEPGGATADALTGVPKAVPPADTANPATAASAAMDGRDLRTYT